MKPETPTPTTDAVMASLRRLDDLMKRIDDREAKDFFERMAALNDLLMALHGVPRTTPRLHEVEHPYYCADRPYHASDLPLEFASWKDFVLDDNGGDFDLNLLFRWDWRVAGGDWCDEGEKSGCLHLYFMGQRKGLFRSVKVRVTKDDEEQVRKWLKPRFEHLKKLWRPL